MPEKTINDTQGAFRIRIAEQALAVHLDWLAKERSVQDVARVRQELAQAGVVEGIQEEALNKFFASKAGTVCIAKGVEPQPGQSGNWEMLFDLNPKRPPEQNMDGSVDFHHVQKWIEVRQSQPIAKHILPVPGIPGRNCYGEVVPAPAPKDPEYKLGEGSCFDPNDPDYVLASRRGVLQKRGSLVCVEPEIHLKGSVDYSTGDIDVSVPVTISEDVKPGFIVRSESSITILGCVQSAKVECGGNLKVGGGILGDPVPTIRVKGNLEVHYVQNAQIEVDGDCSVHKFISDSVLSCGKSLFVGDRLVTSQVLVAGEVTASVLGAEMGSPPRVFLGYEPLMQRELFQLSLKRWQLQKELQQAILELAELKQEIALDQLARDGQRAQKTVTTSSAGSEGVRKNAAREESLQEQIFIQNRKEDELLRSAPLEGIESSLTVQKAVHTGAEVLIGGKRWKLTDSLEGRRVIRQELLSRAAMRILALGSPAFQKEIQTWSDGLQLWSLRLHGVEAKLGMLLKSSKPDVVFFEGRSASQNNWEQLESLVHDANYAETLFLFFSDGVKEEKLDGLISATNFVSVPGLMNKSLLGQVAKNLRL